VYYETLKKFILYLFHDYYEDIYMDSLREQEELMISERSSSFIEKRTVIQNITELKFESLTKVIILSIWFMFLFSIEFNELK
jgi:hypothetical protein